MFHRMRVFAERCLLGAQLHAEEVGGATHRCPRLEPIVAHLRSERLTTALALLADSAFGHPGLLDDAEQRGPTSATGIARNPTIAVAPARAGDDQAHRSRVEGRFVVTRRYGLEAGRFSWHPFRSNASDLLLHTRAYDLPRLFQHHALHVTPLATATPDTIRTRLLELATRVVSSLRWWSHLPAGQPGRPVFVAIHRCLQTLSAPLSPIQGILNRRVLRLR